MEDFEEFEDATQAATAAVADAVQEGDYPAVRGLVDGRGAAEMLGLENLKRFSVWLSKKGKALEDGRGLTGVLALLPEPVGYLNGAGVFDVEEVTAFGIAAGYLVAVEAEPVVKVPPADGASHYPFIDENEAF